MVLYIFKIYYSRITTGGTGNINSMIRNIPGNIATKIFYHKIIICPPISTLFFFLNFFLFFFNRLNICNMYHTNSYLYIKNSLIYI